MKLFGKSLGQLDPPIFISEISCNHGGSLSQAKELIHASKEAGADACKIQTYTPDEMTLCAGVGMDNIINPHHNDDFRIKDGPWKGMNLHDLYVDTHTPYEWLHPLFEYAKQIDIPLFSSVFGYYSLGFLEEVGNPVYKIASFEANDPDFISDVAKKGKPLIISTGMCSPDDVVRAVAACRPDNTVLMHCVSAYPAMYNELNMFKIRMLQGFYPCVVGFSDHTLDSQAAQIAVAMGAKVIEKHLMLEGGSKTEDSEFSCNPKEFKELVGDCCEVYYAIRKSTNDPEDSSRQFRRSLYVVKDMEPGEQFTSENVRSIRPSYGLEPYRYKEVLGKWAKVFIKAGTALKEEHLS